MKKHRNIPEEAERKIEQIQDAQRKKHQVIQKI
jgi:hypothetical protein